MSGEAYLPANMEETVLNTLVMLMGIVVMAFLVGELSNILGNFDPVGNEFEQTVDNLDVRARRPVVWSPSHEVVGGFFSDFAANRDAPRRPTSRATSTRRCSD